MAPWMVKRSGITRSGTYQTWLIAIVETAYFALASLYSVSGNFSFDYSNLFNFSSAWRIIAMQAVVCIDEEMLFRGAILYILVRSWKYRKRNIWKCNIYVSNLCFVSYYMVYFFRNFPGYSFSFS